MANFSIHSQGIYLNWFATSTKIYNTAVYSNGDNKKISRRGIGTVLLDMIWEMTVILTPKFITVPRVFLQVNPKETAVTYYFHRGFKYSKIKNFLSAFPSCNNNGHFIHWLNSLRLMVLTETPNRVKCASHSIFGIQQLLLLSPKKRRAAATKKDGMTPFVFHSQELQKLVSFKAKEKYSMVKQRFKSWTGKAKPIFGWPKADDNQRLCEFPNYRVKLASIIEDYSKGTDASQFFNTEKLCLDIKDDSIDLHHIRPITITPRLITSLIFPNLLIGETVTLLLSYLFRNVKQDFLIWPATALKYLFDKMKTETATEKKMDKIFLDVYTHIFGKSKKKHNTLFKNKYWIVPYNINNDHWILFIFIRPINIFLQPASADLGSCLLIYDSNNSNPDQEFDSIQPGQLIHLSQFLFYGLKKENSIPDGVQITLGNQMKNLKKIGMKSFRQNNGLDCGVYVCVHAREFLLSVINLGLVFTLDEIGAIKPYFGLPENEYSFFRILEIRCAAVVLLSNIVQQHLEFQKNENIVKCFANFTTMLKSCFLNYNDIKQIKDEQRHAKAPVTKTTNIAANLSKDMKRESFSKKNKGVKRNFSCELILSPSLLNRL